MNIYQLVLKCKNIGEMKKFYTDLLEMELVAESEIHFEVMAGTTKLMFERSESLPYYHICFRSGEEFHQHIFNKMAEESLLLSDEKGSYSMFWKGKQAYFVDPDGNILEILERPFLTSDSEIDLPKGWYDVGEIGLPVDNVGDMQKFLNDYITDDQEALSETFAFFGNTEGVFVIVKEGRPWYPTNRNAEIHPIKVYVSGEQNTRLTHPRLPYEMIVKKEWCDDMPAVQMRVARPTNQLEKLIEFYQGGLGLSKIGEFHNHDGYDGVMLGMPGFPYHLEFTQFETEIELPTPTKEHLQVFYIPNRFKLQRVASKLKEMGYHETEPENPYWTKGGITFQDPDGWCVVLMNTVGI